MVSTCTLQRVKNQFYSDSFICYLHTPRQNMSCVAETMTALIDVGLQFLNIAFFILL